MTFDPFFLVIAAAIGLLIFMQFRTAKKRRTEAANLQDKMQPGTEIMTNYGLFGTIVSIDDETNVAVIEVAPGTNLRIHRQSIMKAVEEDVVESESDVEDGDLADHSDVVETVVEAPEFGERLSETTEPTGKSAKKTDD